MQQSEHFAKGFAVSDGTYARACERALSCGGSGHLLALSAVRNCAGRRHGVGVYLYPDKSVYCGEWKEGMKHGSGRMAYADGGVYEGSWKYALI
eukprot:6211065-Pleurochrysis_carterae.AAC.2